MSITTDTPAQIEISRAAAAQVAIAATANTQVATIQLVERAAKAAFAALQEANIAAGNAGAVAVIRAMAAGDAAIALEPFAPARGKQSFLKMKTGAPLSTIKLCVTLAHGRARIEAEMANVSHMSIRRARNLLSPPRATAKKPELQIAWQRATDDERKAVFAVVDFDQARLAFSTEYFKKLEQHFLDQQACIETGGKVTIDLNNPPSVIETARKSIRQALPRERSDGERLNALNKADAIRCKGGFTYDDILPVRDPVNAGTKLVRSARRRAA